MLIILIEKMVLYIDFSKYKKLNDIFSNEDIPYEIIETVSSLSEEGKQLLNDYYDEDSYFFRTFNFNDFINTFYASPSLYPVLYHYTNLNALKGITDSKKLIINSAYKMNDDKEIIYSKNIALDIFKKYSDNHKEFYDFKKRLNESPDSLYIMSFTNNSHSQALSHYGNISIGMNNQEIQNCFGKAGAHGKDSLYDYGYNDFYAFPLKVNYDYDYQYNMIDNLVRRWLVAYRNLEVDPFDMKSILNDLNSELFLLSLLFKRNVLYQEEEIRYVILRRNIHSSDKNVIIPFNSSLFNNVIYSHELKHDSQKIRELLNNNGFNNISLNLTSLPY